MNTQLLIEQLTIAIVASAIIIPTVQRVKGWLPNEKAVEYTSVVLSALIGFGFAFYYADYNLINSAIVGFFSVIGAENVYKLVHDKLKTYGEMKNIDADGVSPLMLEAEEAHLMGDMDE